MVDNLGEALLLGQTGDIQVKERSDGSRTLRRIQGPNEVQQALQILLETVEGEDPLFPDYGVPVLDIIGPFNEDLIAAIVRETLQDDPRVRSVNEVTAEYDTDTDQQNRVVTVEADARLVNAENVTVTQAFGI